MNRQRVLAALLIALMIPLSGCVSNGVDGTQGEEGTPGENGIDGTNGLNGTDGLDGIDGINGTDAPPLLVNTQPLADEDQLCPEGGIMLMFGTDDDGSGELEEDEIDDSSVLCHGLDGIDYVPPEEPYLPTTIPLSHDAVLGSWRSSMTKSNQSIAAPGNCLENDSWLREDGDALIQTMEATGQNTYISHVGDHQPGGCDWLKMNDVLSAAANSTGKSIWLGLPDDLTYLEYRAMMEAYAALDVEDHVGMRVMADDFHEAIAHPWVGGSQGLLGADFVTLGGLLDDVNGRNIPFIPYYPAEMAMIYHAPVAVLGVANCDPNWAGCVNSNHQFHTGHHLSVSWNFSLTEAQAMAGSQMTGFMYENVYNKLLPDDRDVRLLVKFDDVIVENRSLYEESLPVQRIERLNVSLPPTFAGEHQLTIQLQAIDTPISRSWTKMTFFGDLSIDGAGHELELDVGEGWYRNEHPTLEIQQGHFAGTNDAWRLNDILDGFMFRWGMPLSDTAEDHAMFISWLCDQIEDPCIEVYWGNSQWNSEVGTTSEYVQFLQDSAQHTDGIVFWRLDNQQQEPGGGYYAENRIASSQAPILAMYPSNVPATEGWYQSWSWTSDSDGWLNLTFEDSIGSENNPIPNRMQTQVLVNGFVVHTSDPGAAGYPAAFNSEIEAGDLIEIRVETIDSFGSKVWWVEVDGTFADQPLERDMMTYSSDAGTYTKDLFQLAKALFLGEDLADFT